MTIPEQYSVDQTLLVKDRRGRKATNLQGRVFGRLTVMSRAGSTSRRQATWECKCSCGKTCVKVGVNLMNGDTTSCGGHQKSNRLKNLIGQTFGRLHVLSRAGSNSRKNALWLCECECEHGKTKVVVGSSLLSGGTSSCGCLQKEQTIARSTKHGYASRSGLNKAYRRWASMLDRCRNPQNPAWKNYGGRGIKVCERWYDFKNFYTDMGNPPPKLTIERIDNEKGYEPDNCCYADRRAQALNRRIQKSNTTGVENVSFQNNRYLARASINGVRVRLGSFPLSPGGLQAAAEVVKKATQLAKVLS